MNVKELTSAVEALQQQVRELRTLIEQQGAEIVELRTRRETTATQQRIQHFDREQRLLAVARLSARFPNARSFSSQEVAAEIACSE